MKCWELKKEQGWDLIDINGSIDSFNFSLFEAELKNLAAKPGKHIAISFNRAKFVSLPAIKLIGNVAIDIQQVGGQMAILGASEKLKKQIHIYSSLEPMRVLRGPSELTI